MAVKIKFDTNYNAQSPTFVLAKRNGTLLGALPAYNINFKDSMSSHLELSFRISKYDNGIEYSLWNSVKNFKLAWCKEWNILFEIYVETNETNELIKTISAKSLGHAELSQIKLYGVEINTEDDIAREDYKPTVLYDPNNPDCSLLDRILRKAPHYRIKHVDESIASIQRTFTFNNISIADALLQDVSEEIECYVEINCSIDETGSIDRSISIYDLKSHCCDCGERGEFTYVCPKCASINIKAGYGDDTTIFVSTDNLADNITFATDTDSVKNCFKLESGDDLMDATIINCNPNGSAYIWHISDDLKEDMSEELVSKIQEYNLKYSEINNERNFGLETIITNYNRLVDFYKSSDGVPDKVSENITGYAALTDLYYNTIDFSVFLKSKMLPVTTLEETTAAEQLVLLKNGLNGKIAVSDTAASSKSAAEKAVLEAAKVFVDPRYEIDISTTSYNTSNHNWIGNFCITRYSKESDKVDSDSISLILNTNDREAYLKGLLDQRVKRDSGTTYGDIVTLLSDSSENLSTVLTLYCYDALCMCKDCCQACLDVLTEQGAAATDLYKDYYKKLSSINDSIQIRQSHLSSLENNTTGKELIEETIKQVHQELDLEAFLGEKLWLEFAAYRREDTYSNTNYISDGLSNSELIHKAVEFIEKANDEIYKSANLQHSITSTLKNLLVMKEFLPIVKYFSVGNFIRIRVENEIYRLRLLEYEIDFDDLEKMPVTFSDVVKVHNGYSDIESILKQASSMATSYGAVMKQSEQGQKSNSQINNWIENGLSLTNMKIVDTAANQNIVWDKNSFLCREYSPITDSYDAKQLKIINSGLYLTTDNWNTVSTAVGNCIVQDPETGDYISYYGINGEKIVGKMILSESLGIFNESNNIMIDKNGISIKLTDDSVANQKLFVIKDANGSNKLYIDENGNLVTKGVTNATGGTIGGWTISDRTIYQEKAGYKVVLAHYNNDSTTSRVFHCTNTETNKDTFKIRRDGSALFSRAVFQSINGSTDDNDEDTTGDKIIIENGIQRFYLANTLTSSISPATWTGYSGETSGIEISGRIKLKYGLYLDSAMYLYSKLTTGGYARLIGISSSNNILIGDTNSGSKIGLYSSDSIVFSAPSVTLGTGAAVTSDERVKNNILEFDSRHEKLFMNLVPCTFKYNYGTSDRTHFGYMAQQLKSAITDSGLTTKDVAAYVENEDSNYEDGYICSIRYGEIVPLNTYMIQKCVKDLDEFHQIVNGILDEFSELKVEVELLKEEIKGVKNGTE